MKNRNIYKKYVKRILDIILCLLALIVLFPVFLITACAIKISDPGPVFYYSARLGKNNVAFHFYKFRSMKVANGKDKGLCVADEDRLFQVGRIIRRLKIDELPQLINVIRGDMSIVGPRPMVSDSFYTGKYKEVSRIKPGLTSAASLYDYTVGDLYTDDDTYRKEVVPIKLEMELYYVNNESFLYDASLIWRTIKTIVLVLVKCPRMPSQPELKYIDIDVDIT